MSGKKQNDVNDNFGDLLLGHVYSKYYEYLVLYAYKFVNNIEIAKDLTQDAFLFFIKKEDKEDVLNIKSFLFQSVRNNCINYLNHKAVENVYETRELQRIKSEVEFYYTNSALIEKDLHEKLMNVIDRLPEKYKIAIKLSRFDNYSNKEIAEKLEIPLRTVETRIYRALVILRKKLDKNSFLLFYFMLSDKRIVHEL